MREGGASECGERVERESKTHRGKLKKRMVSRSTPAPSVRERGSQKRRKPAFCGGIFFTKCKQIRLLRQFNSPIVCLDCYHKDLQFSQYRKGVRNASPPPDHRFRFAAGGHGARARAF